MPYRFRGVRDLVLTAWKTMEKPCKCRYKGVECQKSKILRFVIFEWHLRSLRCKEWEIQKFWHFTKELTSALFHTIPNTPLQKKLHHLSYSNQILVFQSRIQIFQKAPNKQKHPNLNPPEKSVCCKKAVLKTPVFSPSFLYW